MMLNVHRNLIRFVRDWEGRVSVRAQELSESRGGRPGLLVLNSPVRSLWSKATLNDEQGYLQGCLSNVPSAYWLPPEQQMLRW